MKISELNEYRKIDLKSVNQTKLIETDWLDSLEYEKAQLERKNGREKAELELEERESERRYELEKPKVTQARETVRITSSQGDRTK